jgi:predicted acyltransferase
VTSATLTRTAPPAAPTIRPSGRPARLRSLDVLRGLAVFAMLLVNNPGVPDATPLMLRHASWHGLTPPDVVFPVFLLVMGAAMPLSARADRPRAVVRRVVLLALLGVGLTWLKHHELSYGVLQHIAGSYLAAWLVLRLPRRAQVGVVVAVLALLWPAYLLLGWWPDLVPEGPVVMVASMPNVVAGAWLAGALTASDPERVRASLARWGFGATLAGLAVALAVPVNKRLWTPSFAVLTIGLGCLLLLVLHVVLERRVRARWARPFELLGRNPIAVYVVVSALAYTVLPGVRRTLVAPLTDLLAPAAVSVGFALVVSGLGVALAVALARRRLYLRV